MISWPSKRANGAIQEVPDATLDALIRVGSELFKVRNEITDGVPTALREPDVNTENQKVEKRCNAKNSYEKTGLG